MMRDAPEIDLVHNPGRHEAAAAVHAQVLSWLDGAAAAVYAAAAAAEGCWGLGWRGATALLDAARLG